MKLPEGRVSLESLAALPDLRGLEIQIREGSEIFRGSLESVEIKNGLFAVNAQRLKKWDGGEWKVHPSAAAMVTFSAIMVDDGKPYTTALCNDLGDILISAPYVWNIIIFTSGSRVVTAAPEP